MHSNIFKNRPKSTDVLNAVFQSSRSNEFLSFIFYFLKHLLKVTGLCPFKNSLKNNQSRLIFYNHIARLLWCQSRAVSIAYTGQPKLKVCYKCLPLKELFLIDEFPSPEDIIQYRLCVGYDLNEKQTCAYGCKRIEFDNLALIYHKIPDKLSYYTSFSHYLAGDTEKNHKYIKVLNRYYKLYKLSWLEINRSEHSDKSSKDTFIQRALPITPKVVEKVLRNVGKHLRQHRKYHLKYQNNLTSNDDASNVTTANVGASKDITESFKNIKDIFQNKFPITPFELFIDNMEFYLRYVESQFSNREDNKDYWIWASIVHLIYAFRHIAEVSYFNVLNGIPKLGQLENFKIISKNAIADYINTFLNRSDENSLLSYETSLKMCLYHVVSRYFYDAFEGFIQQITQEYLDCNIFDIFQKESTSQCFKDVNQHYPKVPVFVDLIKLFTFDIEPIYFVEDEKSQILFDVYERCQRWILDSYNFISYCRLSPRASGYLSVISFEILSNPDDLHAEMQLIDYESSDPPKRIAGSYLHCPMCYLAIWAKNKAPSLSTGYSYKSDVILNSGCIGYFFKNWNWPKSFLNDGLLVFLFLGKNAFDLLLDQQRKDENEINHLLVNNIRYKFIDILLYLLTSPHSTITTFRKHWSRIKRLILVKPKNSWDPKSFYYHGILSEFNTVDQYTEERFAKPHLNRTLESRSVLQLGDEGFYAPLYHALMKQCKGPTLQVQYSSYTDYSNQTPTLYDDDQNDDDIGQSLAELNVNEYQQVATANDVFNVDFLLRKAEDCTTFSSNYSIPHQYIISLAKVGTTTKHNNSFTLKFFRDAKLIDEVNQR
ncbi:uncharacterized protein TRIADDRAFT_59614 [Trichoplax adhaerens]|uniref:Uncharacterized protein n=1 Tax=Trichoplax adhaerens TaxID=10228 RepID=B3S5H2_TRIAD|nr:predicted protein [Trichoplax adhaerens]EDV21914.1 predicted protein [Trichoplax adhaerens]|eukprot:XP_002115551.1 predicted protein [Trichoplax adhaerens]